MSTAWGRQKKTSLLELYQVGNQCIQQQRSMAFTSLQHKTYGQSGKKKDPLKSFLTGCPKKITEHMERSIIWESLASQQKPFCEIANAASPRISTSTIQNILRQKGYHHCVARKVPYLTQAHKRARLAWAQICKVFTIRNWQKKIWSDECYVYLGDNCGRIFVTWCPGEESRDDCCVVKFSQSSVCIMVWACIMKAIGFARISGSVRGRDELSMVPATGSGWCFEGFLSSSVQGGV